MTPIVNVEGTIGTQVKATGKILGIMSFAGSILTTIQGFAAAIIRVSRTGGISVYIRRGMRTAYLPQGERGALVKRGRRST